MALLNCFVPFAQRYMTMKQGEERVILSENICEMFNEIVGKDLSQLSISQHVNRP